MGQNYCCHWQECSLRKAERFPYQEVSWNCVFQKQRKGCVSCLVELPVRTREERTLQHPEGLEEKDADKLIHLLLVSICRRINEEREENEGRVSETKLLMLNSRG